MQRNMADFFTKSSIESNNNNTKNDNINSPKDSLPTKKKFSYVRKYNADYLKFGFVVCPTSEENLPKPQCVVCGCVLSNECMKPAKLIRHLKSKHPELEEKSLDFFHRKSVELKVQKVALKSSVLIDKSLVKASYLVAWRIAKCKKPYSIAENLIKPCLVEVCSEILGPTAGKKMRTVPLSNDTIQRRIIELAVDIEEQLIHKLKKSFFSIQMDESTDVSNKAILLCYVRFVDYDLNDVTEELLCCLELPSQTTSVEIYKAINKYIEQKSLDWKKCVALCTDGAASMTDRHSGVATKIKEVAADGMIFTHCFIHREHLAAKKLSPELTEILSQAVKIVNYIKCNALNSRLFVILCEEMGSEHEHLLLHAEVRWLSRGKVLKRLFELREEACTFLQLHKKNGLSNFFSDNDWVAKLAYLSDIFSLINEVNLSLQGKNTTIFNMYNKIDAFKKKLKHWSSRVQENNFEMFDSFSDFVNSVDVDMNSIQNVITEHLKALSRAFENYYPPEQDIRTGNLWIINPFIENNNSKLTRIEQESLFEISSDLGLKSLFETTNISQFWVKVKDEYPILYEKAIKILLIFATTYLCETTFSAMVIIKSKQRNRLIITPSLRLAVTTLTARIDKLTSEKEQQPSH